MQYAIEVDPGARIAFLHVTDSINTEEGYAILAELGVHPDFERGFGLVWDLRDMHFQPTAEEVLEGFETVIRFKPVLRRSRMAFVVSPELETASEVSAALHATEGFDAQVFWDLDTAREWVKETCASDSAP